MSDSVKSVITDAERLQLAEKLDKELDDYINGLEKKRYEDGWPEDRWQEEMEKHPFFMKKEPLPGDEVHPLYVGMQQLKYDPDENTCEDLALNYKDDGNFYMKHKKFNMSVLSFTEGLKARCEKPEVNSVLYNNRSAAHFFLKNYRSALEDAEKALELNSDYHKARWRAAQCCLYLKRYDRCHQHCQEIIDKDPNNQLAKDLIKKSIAEDLQIKRDNRKQVSEEKKKAKDLLRTFAEIKSRGIKFENLKPNDEITQALLKPILLPLEDFMVKSDDNGVLSWPAAFSYPEFLLSDFQQQLSENIKMEDCISSLLAEPMPCDIEHKYQKGMVSMYYENRKASTVHKVHLNKTVKEVMQEKNFYVIQGALLFYIVPSGTHIEQEFKITKRHPMSY